MSAAAPAVGRRVDVRLRQSAMVGIGLGVLAFFVALPPITVRSYAWPIALGILAVAPGIFAVSRGEKRLGWGAIAAGLLGIAGGLAAIQSSVSHLDSVFVWSGLLAATLSYATPLTYGALGGMVSERSGVVNIALEGMMLVGAFFGIWGSVTTGNWVLGVLIAMGMGGLFALVYGFFAIHLRADQIVGGTAINFLALGVTGYFFIQIYGANGTPDLTTGHGVTGESIPDVHLSSGHNFFSRVFGDLNLMIWIAIALLFVSYVLVFRTSWGLRLRSVGEHPLAADTVGIDVYRTRYIAVTISGMLAAMGGAYLSIGFVHSFNENMTEGRGFIALAALIFGKWRPFGAFGAACLFGFSTAVAQQLPTAYGTASGTLFNALPYVLTLVAVAGVVGRSVAPAADGRPYRKQ